MSNHDKTRQTTAPTVPSSGAPDALLGAIGVPRLDEILDGGFPSGSLVLIVGQAGSGKSTLAAQIATHAARNGQTALMLMALSESTSKLIAHLGAFTFFDHELIGGPLQFLSLQGARGEGIDAARDAIIAEARRVRANIVLLDGFRGLLNVDHDPASARQFLYALSATLNALGATTVITCEANPRGSQYLPESAAADIIIGLYSELEGSRHVRGIEIIKSRAGSPLLGMHTLAIGPHGAQVYPQLEARVAAEESATEALPARTAPHTRRRVSFGLPGLDAMLRGGIPEGSTTLLTGGAGAGKTLLALWYALAGIRAGERVVHLSLRESREQGLQATAAFAPGPELAAAAQPGGNLTLVEVSPIRMNVDILADQLLNALDSARAQRLIIDSVTEIERAILRGADPERLDDYLAALLSAVRSRQVTTLLIRQTGRTQRDLGVDALSTLADSAIALQQVVLNGEMHRIVSVLKLRYSDHDTAPRELRIAAPAGLQALDLSAKLASALAELSDEQAPQPTSAPRRQRRMGMTARGSVNA